MKLTSYFDAEIKAYKRRVAAYAATYAQQAKKELAVLAKCGRI